jgi:hypothetical protein
VTNWAEYDAGLRARGSLTVWFTPEAIAAWRAAPRTGRGGQPCYSALAITTALTLRAVFRLALRQTEGLIGSIIALLGLDLPVPDHTTLSRRAETLELPRPRPGSEPAHLLDPCNKVVRVALKAAMSKRLCAQKFAIGLPYLTLHLCTAQRHPKSYS